MYFDAAAAVADTQTVIIMLAGKYTDFTIHCNDYKQEVHRVVICNQSVVFDKTYSSGFTAGTDRPAPVYSR